MRAWMPAYVDALGAEIMSVLRAAPERVLVKTIYFGGGTPSLMQAAQVERVIRLIQQETDVFPYAEITVEVNPGTVRADWLFAVRDAGVNRLSIGMQSADADELQMLGRIHPFALSEEVVAWARQAGFENLSLDLIFSLPGQTLAAWQRSIEAALTLQPEHLSLYALTLEPGTRLEQQVASGILPEPDDDMAAEMYGLARAMLAAAGFSQYEISNWARTRHGKLLASQHNLQYWRGLPYLGFGVGAHGYAGGVRTANVSGVDEYILRMRNENELTYPVSKSVDVITRIDIWTAIEEHMMMGLRLVEEGVSENQFRERFGVSLGRCFGPQIQKLTQQGLLEYVERQEDYVLRLTPAAYFISNRVFTEFVGNPNPLEQ
jgi:oxygen-independent coproporphyrinogen-3 oxidase